MLFRLDVSNELVIDLLDLCYKFIPCFILVDLNGGEFLLTGGPRHELASVMITVAHAVLANVIADERVESITLPTHAYFASNVVVWALSLNIESHN